MVRCIGTVRVGPLLGDGGANPTGLCGGSSRDELMLDRSGAGDNERGDNDGEFGLRGGGSSTSGATGDKGSLTW